MSKASEWAKFIAQRRDVPQFRAISMAVSGSKEREWFACVTDNGDLSLRGVLGPEQALQLRDWLTETFDEVKK